MKSLCTGIFSLLIVVSQAKADRILNVTASTPDMGSSFGTDLVNTVNGNGLSSLSLNATHAHTIPANSWVSSDGILTGNIIFNFGSALSIDSFSFWNQNGGGPGALGSTGIQGVTVSTSLDGITFTPLAGGPTQFSQVTGNGDVQNPEIFNFNQVSAQFFEFTVTSNWGDPAETGFAEVGFDAIPEPATWSFMSLGILGLAIRLRTRRPRANA